MLLDLGERRDLAFAVAVEQQARDPRSGGARGVLRGRVPDVKRLCGQAAGELESDREDRRVGLARPGGGRG